MYVCHFLLFICPEVLFIVLCFKIDVVILVSGSFYIPLVLILFLYVKIFIKQRSRFKKRAEVETLNNEVF